MDVYAETQVETVAKQAKWLLVVRGILAIVFGILVWVWPGPTLLVLIGLFGIYALATGLFAIAAAARSARSHQRRWLLALSGVLCIAAGILAFIWPGRTALALLFLIGIWAIVSGVSEIAAAFSGNRSTTDEWLLVLGGVVSVLFGIILLVYPSTGLLALVWLIGVYAIIYGVMQLASAFVVGQIQRDIQNQQRMTPASLGRNYSIHECASFRWIWRFGAPLARAAPCFYRLPAALIHTQS